MKKNICISEMYCTKCGKQGISIPRNKGDKRKGGHLKKIYCPYCREETNFVEIPSKSSYTYEHFLIEFNKGNFINGERKQTIRQCLSNNFNTEVK